MAIQKRDPETGIRLQTYEKGDYLPMRSDDSMQNVLQTGIDTIRREIKSGAPSTYPDTPEGFRAFQQATAEYFERIRSHNECLEEGQRAMIPDVEGLAITLGISRVTLFNYGKRGGEWKRFIEVVKDVIAAAKKSAIYDFRMPPVFGIFDLKVNHDYIEKSELKLTTAGYMGDDVRLDSPETIAARHAGAKMPEPIDLTDI